MKSYEGTVYEMISIKLRQVQHVASVNDMIFEIIPLDLRPV